MSDDPFERLRAADPPATGSDELARPRPGHPAIVRVRERTAPWVAWFGLRRLVLAAVTVVALVAGGWWLLRAPTPPTEAGLPRAGAASASSVPPAGATATVATTTTGPPGSVVVHVAGAVVAPGVYELPGAARAADAVTAAGGPAPGAQLDALNLAAPVQDGSRVYVPVEGEPVPPPVGPAPTGTPAPAPVDVNRASADELDALPGIGPATALAIVTHRATNGPFATVDDLEEVRGIGPAKLEAIRPLVTT